MKKVLFYVIVVSWLFSMLDWQVIHITRWSHPEYNEWIHAHEKQYSLLTTIPEYILCTPCVGLKPIFTNAIMNSLASREEIENITHAPSMNLSGFYHLIDRRYSWTFVSWLDWFLYWIPLSFIWWIFAKRFFNV